MTQAGSIVGTAAYLAPEQALGEEVTAAADIYSLGCVLYELLTGRTPYVFETLPELVVKHKEEAIPPLRELRAEVPERVEAAVMHALARNPGYRPESAAALAEELAITPEQAAWAAAASHGRLAKARSLLSDEAVRLRRAAALDLAQQLAAGRSSGALDAAATVLGLADEVTAAARQRQASELAEFEETYGKGRGSGTLRRRIETRHRRELRRVRFDAIREAVSDLLGVYRDMAALRAASPEGAVAAGETPPGAGTPPGEVASAEGPGPAAGVPLAHPDRAATTARLAATVDPAAAVRAAGALEEADRRLAIGAAPQLTLEAAFLSVQAALRSAPMPISRLAIR
jgi:serine/threonine-protein kinase